MATKIGQLAQELSRTNPWWRDPQWARLDPDLRDAATAGIGYQSRVLSGLDPGGLYILRGPRRVGKTVAVKQQIRDLIEGGVPPTSIIRLAVDGWDAKDLRSVAQNTALPLLPPGHRRIWLFDEISAVTGAWDEQIKWLRDNDTEFRDATVVLTGSNATALTEAAGTLAGRRGPATANRDRTLLPIGFRTFVELSSPEALPPRGPRLALSDLRSLDASTAFRDLIPWLDQLVESWEHYLLYGGFPRAVAAVAQGQPIPSDFVDDLFGVIAGDAFRGSRLSSSTEMALLERLWGSMASPLNLSNVGDDIGSNHQVVARHVEYLRDSYLLWNCPQRQPNSWLPKQRAQDKVYAIDPLVARLPHLRNNNRADIDPTVLAEMQIGAAVRRRIIEDHPGAIGDDCLFYLRTPARKEIDFTSEFLAGTAIEGKYGEGGRWRAEAATVDASEWDGILCTRNVLDVDDPSRAWAVPAAFVTYLIDT